MRLNLPRGLLLYGPAAKPARSCFTCRHMNADGTCEVVSGIVRPDDACIAWGQMR